MADKLVQQNFNEIIIDDGSVKVPIRNKHGEQIGGILLPTDRHRHCGSLQQRRRRV